MSIVSALKSRDCLYHLGSCPHRNDCVKLGLGKHVLDSSPATGVSCVPRIVITSGGGAG